MSQWDITVSAGSTVGSGTDVLLTTISGVVPGDFDGATINSVTVLSAPTVTSDSATDDTIGIRFFITTTVPADVFGSDASNAASMCYAVLGNSATSATITDGTSRSPNPTTAVAADWDEVRYSINYSANMKNDGETMSWSSFTVRVDYTAAAGQDDLLADDVESLSEVTSPAIGQEHALTATSVESLSELTSPAVGQEHALLANDVESITEVSAPTLSQIVDILANDVESLSEVSVPQIGQVHVLAATSVQTTSELTSPAIGQEHALLANDVESLSELTAPTLAESSATDDLLANDVESLSEVSAPQIGQIHALLATGIQSTSEITNPAIGQEHALLADDVQSLSELTLPVLAEPGAVETPVASYKTRGNKGLPRSPRLVGSRYQ